VPEGKMRIENLGFTLLRWVSMKGLAPWSKNLKKTKKLTSSANEKTHTYTGSASEIKSGKPDLKGRSPCVERITTFTDGDLKV